MNAYELQIQAEYYSNIPILDRSFRSTVHLEDKQDEYFWDILLQKYRPGKYYYVYHSKRSNIPGGCKECLKYKEFLSNRFFICIDSDLRYPLKEKDDFIFEISRYVIFR